MLVLAPILIVAATELRVVNVLFPVLRRIFVLDTGSLGLLTGIGLLARMCFGAPWGMMADRYGRKRALLAAGLLCCCCVLGTGLAATYAQFVIFYSFGAIGAVAAEPIINSLLSDFFLPLERGKAFGIMRGMMSLGSGIFVPAIGWLSAFAEGWRFAFFLIGAVQIAACVLAAILFQEPAVGASETIGVIKGRTASFAFRDAVALLRIPSVQILAANYMLATGVVMLQYLPTFIVEVRGYSVQAAARMFGLLQVGAVCGAFLGGALGDWSARCNPRQGRLILMQAYLATVAVLTILLFQVPWGTAGYSYLLLFVFGMVFPVGFTGCVLPTLSNVVLPEMRSTAFGLLESLFQGMSLTAVSVAVGFFANRVGLQRMLLLAGTLPYLANASLWFLLYRTYPVDIANMQHELDSRRVPAG